MDVREARSRATAMLAAIRRGEDVSCETAEGHLRGRRRDSVPASRAGLEVGDPLREPMLPAQSAPAALCRGARIADIGRDDVRNWFASLHATPVAADRSMPVLSVIMREAGSDGPSARGVQPLPGHQAIPPEGARTLPVRRRDPPVVRNAVGPCGPSTRAGCGHPPSPAYGMPPQERDPDAALVGLPRGPFVPPRQQDRPQNRVAVAAGQAHSRCIGANRPMGLSGRAREPPSERGVAEQVLAPGPYGNGPVRRAPSRFAAHACQPRAETGQDHPRDRKTARTPQSGDDAQIHASCDTMVHEAAETVGAVLEG